MSHLIKLSVKFIGLCTILFYLSYQFISCTALDSQQIDAYIQSYKDFSGAVLVAQGDKTILKKGYGCAHYEFNIPNDNATRFPIASNTKIFTAIAIMLLQEKQMLGVHDPVDKYIPGFPKTITLHHLLTHTSGLPNYYKHWNAICACKDLHEIINAVKSWELEFTPGSQYCYSNTGYLVLAHIVATVSGLTFEQFLSVHIFEPLKMYDTGSISTGRIVLHKASGYIAKDALLYTAPAIMNPITLLGNGDLYSSISDMHIFMQALFSGTIISKNSLAITLLPHVKMESSSDRAHGYGWFIDTQHGKRIVDYSGALVGFLSKVVHFIDENITIVILTNREAMAEFSTLCDGLVATCFLRKVGHKSPI